MRAPRTSIARNNDLAAWLDGSAFIREGQPIVWYHGTDALEDFTVFTDWAEGSIGIHFATAMTASARLSSTRLVGEPGHEQGCRVIPVYCRAQRPLRLRDLHCWEIDRVAGELAELGLISPEVEIEIVDGCDEFAIFAAIEATGYDCVVYANETESEGRFDDSLLIWRSELVKSVFARGFEPLDPQIMPGVAESPRDRNRWLANNQTIEEAALRIAAIGTVFPSP